MKRIGNFISSHYYPSVFFIIFSAIILKISFFGFSYYPQLDDYIQYFNYATSENYITLILNENLFASRPLAALCDLYVWAQMPLYLSAVALSAMYALSGVLFLKVFKKYFNTSLFFAVFYALLPLGFEGTYWISASARVIPGLFFTSLTLYLFVKMLNTKRLLWQIPLLISALLSFGFYEQMLVLSLALILMTALLEILRHKNFFALWGLTIFAPLALYFAFTSYFAADSSYIAGRMEIILPTSKYYFDTFLPTLIKQIGASFIHGGSFTLFKGFVRGIGLIFTKGVYSAIFIIPIVLLIFLTPQKEEKKSGRFALIYGFLAALAPITPFFIIANPWFSLRSTVASFVGAALIADLIIRKLGKRELVCAVFAFLCLTASVSELYDYKQTRENDLAAANAILKAGEEYQLYGNVGILSLNSSLLEDQNYKYHDHIVGVTNSDWALYGALVHLSGGELPFLPCPLATDEAFFWEGWNREIKNIGRFDHLFYYDNETKSLEKLEVVQNDREYLLYSSSKLMARVWSEDDYYGYIELY